MSLPRTPTLVAITLLLVGANLRPAIVAVAPLLPEIRLSARLSPTFAGLLTTLPLVCFGAFAFLSPALGRRIAAERLLLAVLVALIGGICVRLLPGDVALFAGTTLAGAAVAIANVVLPSLIKSHFPGHVALMTGAYATALSLGAALGAGITVPLRQASGLSWRPTLALWAIPVALSCILLVAPARAARRRAAGLVRRSGGIWRDRVAWSVTAFMGLQSLEYFAAVAWLPSDFQAHGMSPGASGWLVSYASIISVPACLGAPLLGRRLRNHRALVGACTLAGALALVGIAIDPRHLAYVWMTFLGLSQGSALSLALGFIAQCAPDARRVAELSTLAQGGGYLLASSGPVALGALHDLSGGWTIPFLALAGLLVPLLAVGTVAASGHTVRADVPGDSGRFAA